MAAAFGFSPNDAELEEVYEPSSCTGFLQNIKKNIPSGSGRFKGRAKKRRDGLVQAIHRPLLNKGKPPKYFFCNESKSWRMNCSTGTIY